MAEETNAEYQEAVHHALERCQFVEETLRIYIDLAVQIAKLELKPHFPVRFTKTDFSKLPLGRLVDIYSRLSDNASLKSLLREITKRRNYVAHRSLLFTLGELQDLKHMGEAVKEMREIEQQAKKAQDALLDERWTLQRSLNSLRHLRK